MRAALLLLLISATLACPDSDEHCIACSGSKCVECADAYLSPDGKCLAPATRVDNCAQYKADGVCAYCLPGFYTTTAGKCAKIPVDGCAELASSTACAVCKNGVLVKDGACSSGNKCGISNCDMCMVHNGTEVCAKCGTGYAVLIDKGVYSCKAETSDNSHCLYLNANNSAACAVCDYNYYMSNQHCAKSSQYKLDAGAGIFGPILALCLALLFK